MTKQFEVRAFTYLDEAGTDYRDYGRFDTAEAAQAFIDAKLETIRANLVDFADTLEDEDKQYMMDVAKEAYHVAAV